jgi:enoyl-CoA hydratase/carnithine racemase
MPNFIELHREPNSLRIEFNRPEKKNAITEEMYTALATALRTADADPAVRVVVIHGSDGCFTAGNDLGDFLENPPAGEDAPVYEFLSALTSLTKPVVAGVSGVAVGIGTTMLLHCDIVVASRDARFSLPFAKLALCPEAGSSLLLPEMAGTSRAMELMLLGNTFYADEAHRIGLVARLVSPGEAISEARHIAGEIAELPPASVRLTKQLVREARGSRVEDAMAREAAQFAKRLKSPEATEAFTAFAEKRRPDYSRFE